MPTRDARIDAYIAKSADFARPILTHLRAVIHEGCPDVVETLKWSMPSFEYKGMLCGMGAFKQHCTFGFWKHDLVVGKGGSTAARKPAARGRAQAGTPKSAKADDGMGQFGRITKLSDLPARRVLLAYVRKAAKLNDAGIKLPRSKQTPVRSPSTPPDLAAALRRNKAAAACFAGLSNSHRREYIEWLTEAKKEETRARRLATAIEWLSEGKSRNWKYERR